MMTLALVIVTSGAACSKKAETVDKSADKPADKPADMPADKPADKPADMPADKPGAPAPAKGGCSYITEAEASDALGQPSKYRANDGDKNCVIDPVAEPSATTTAVDFTVTLGDTSAYAALEKNAKPLPGVGDKAVIDATPMMAQVAAIKGTNSLVMTVSGPKAADPAAIKAFADKVFSHL